MWCLDELMKEGTTADTSRLYSIVKNFITKENSVKVSESENSLGIGDVLTSYSCLALKYSFYTPKKCLYNLSLQKLLPGHLDQSLTWLYDPRPAKTYGCLTQAKNKHCTLTSNVCV